jgi:hypothetical protein
MSDTLQPKAVPRSRQDQPLPVRATAQQETTGGPTGQTPLGRKVEGQQTVDDPGADGVERSWGSAPEHGRPNQ